MTSETNGNGGRRVAVAVFGSLALLLLFALLAENAFNLKFLVPHGAGSILLFTSLSAVTFLLFLTLFILLLRNILKLYASERSRVLGSRLRTRMLVGALLLSIAPAFFMALFNYLLMNRSIDRWFSQPVVQLRGQSMQLALQLTRYASANAQSEAESIANAMDTSADTPAAKSARLNLFRRHKVTLQGGFAIVYRDQTAIGQYQVPARSGRVVLLSSADPRTETAVVARQPWTQVILEAAQRTDGAILEVGDSGFAMGAASSPNGDIVVVGLPLPPGAASAISDIESGNRHYWSLLGVRHRVRQTYFLLLLLLTGLTLFVSSWLALFISKQITRPVEALADAMDAMASGDYKTRVDAAAAGELNELMRSFNHMATDLETSRSQLEASSWQLSAANASIDERRRELETVLETIPSGVATLDSDLKILQANRAFLEIFDPLGDSPLEGKPIRTLLSPESSDEIGRAVRRGRRLPSASGEVEAPLPQGTLHLIFTVAELRGPAAERSGPAYLIVMDNVTDLLRAQKQMAWKEVAQRVAHEIKNPLTPIALSAERIERHLDRGWSEASARALRGATAAIRSSVETLRQLVDRFAALADFPASRPKPTDLRTTIESTLALFEGRLDGIEVRLRLAPDLPLVMADAEAMKRALSNLIDNAAEAMQGRLLRVLTVSTGWNAAQTMAEISVSDTGHGITGDVGERLFLPFFSTRRRGTGLGLSIAAKIVQEHQGTIRVEKNAPVGARFIVEIPFVESAGIEPHSLDEENVSTS